MKTSASKYRRTKEEIDSSAPVHRKWGRVWHASDHCGLSKSEVYKVLKDPTSGVESFIYKGNPSNKSGCRMINLESLDAYLDRMSQQARMST